LVGILLVGPDSLNYSGKCLGMGFGDQRSLEPGASDQIVNRWRFGKLGIYHYGF
jgi:hypothetical protein